MKKALATVLAISMALSMGACSTSNSGGNSAGSQTNQNSQAAKADFPVRSLQNIIPFSAGGGTDVWNRALMNQMSKVLGQTIVSTNMTGGSAGSIGVDYAWKAKHDGYTLCGTSETPLTIPIMTTSDQTSKDWKFFIAAGSPGVLCVNRKSKYKSMDEILNALKDKPQSVSIAGTTGGLWFALAKLFDSYGDVPFKWVPYNGSGDAIKGSVSYEADCVCASAGEVKEFVRSGDLIPIAVMDNDDWNFPEFGTVKAVSSYVPALKQYLPLKQFLGFMVPADTDSAVVDVLTDAFDEAMKSDEIKKFADEQLCTLYGLTGDEASKMAADTESKLCWDLYNMGQAKFSPEKYNIPKP
ncbi:tripartite tricarboxylate transporter substrate binding protein [Caproicibacter sp. BJN0012]|uniref:tripartite tricarboxylate transporter substrate binding protein n=1 Tax=Caproicibacter sp. BJN0012 TaxID=3110227 RepID=UPI002E0DD9C8